mgnify:CR=1 FL=1|jgi:hypothetical protein
MSASKGDENGFTSESGMAARISSNKSEPSEFDEQVAVETLHIRFEGKAKAIEEWRRIRQERNWEDMLNSMSKMRFMVTYSFNNSFLGFFNHVDDYLVRSAIKAATIQILKNRFSDFEKFFVTYKREPMWEEVSRKEVKNEDKIVIDEVLETCLGHAFDLHVHIVLTQHTEIYGFSNGNVTTTALIKPVRASAKECEERFATLRCRLCNKVIEDPENEYWCEICFRIVCENCIVEETGSRVCSECSSKPDPSEEEEQDNL